MITDEERHLGTLLRAVRAPLSNADVTRAVERGRRRRRRRGVAAVAAATVVVVAMGLGAVAVRRTLAGPDPVATTTCEVAVLPNLPGRVLKELLALDPTGRYAVGEFFYRGIHEESHYVRWDGARELVSLDLDVNNTTDSSTSVLPDGAVLGGGGVGPKVMILDGRTVRLAPPPGYRYVRSAWVTPDGGVGAWVETANDGKFALAGWLPPVAPSPDGPTVPAATSVPVPNFLPLASGATGVTVGIRWDPDHFVVRHPDGRERDLALPEGLLPFDATQVTGDWAVGTAVKVGDGERPGLDTTRIFGRDPVAVRWNLVTGAVERIAGAQGRVAPGVAADGTVAFIDVQGRPTLRAPDGRETRLPVPPGRDVADHFLLSDDGRTIAGALRVPATSDKIEAVRWRC